MPYIFKGTPLHSTQLGGGGYARSARVLREGIPSVYILRYPYILTGGLHPLLARAVSIRIDLPTGLHLIDMAVY
jgi:hypothetical protein